VWKSSILGLIAKAFSIATAKFRIRAVAREIDHTEDLITWLEFVYLLTQLLDDSTSSQPNVSGRRWSSHERALPSATIQSMRVHTGCFHAD